MLWTVVCPVGGAFFERRGLRERWRDEDTEGPGMAVAEAGAVIVSQAGEEAVH